MLKQPQIDVFLREQQLFECKICKGSFSTKADFMCHANRHMIYQQCTECDAYFPNPQSLAKHMSVHAREFECCKCGAIFKDPQKLTVHNDVCQLIVHKCNLCDAHFRLSDLLLTHTQKQHTYKCTACPAQFENEGDLQLHVVAHVKEPVAATKRKLTIKPTCEHCNMEFASSYGLKRHNETCGTVTIKMVKCHECDKVFETHFERRQHMLVVHAQSK